MKWKIFLTVCISSFIISFPQNIIGCGAGVDAYDYYSSFFNPNISIDNNLRPFYYTSYEFLYDSEEPVATTDVLAAEWKTYCGSGVSEKDVKSFLMEYSQKDIAELYFGLDKNKPYQIPDSVKQNSMTNYFVQQKDFDALGYIVYAKKVEPYVTGDYDSWQTAKHDTVEMAGYLKDGLQFYAEAKKDFFKLKYAYQIIRLAHYSKNYADAIKYYDALIPILKAGSVLKPLSLALKAGALYHTDNKMEAAYLFSKAFSATDAKKVSNFISFKWAQNDNVDRETHLEFCKTNEEKANMLSMFALGSAANETEAIDEIYSLSPQNKHLETLVAREINKLESSYFTPLLNKQKGGKLFYYNWEETATDSLLDAGKQETRVLSNLLLKMSKAKNSSQALYLTAAAYCFLMTKNFAKADEYLLVAKKLDFTQKVKDQWMLTNLLLRINEAKKIDVQTEELILPSIKWLRQKAKDETSIKIGWDNISQWSIFYRNIITTALAKKYHAQGDIFKELLCVGNADKISGESNYNTLDFLHNETDIKDIENLYALMTSKGTNAFEKYMINNNAIKLFDVTEFAGTAYLRSYDYKNAITWLQKSGASKKDTIFKSAFIELLEDIEERLPTEKKTTSKLLFAQEMLEAQGLAESDKINAAKHFYKLATGYYNITYYGHAWELVQYYRSTVDGYYIPQNATAFQKQYYGCFAAHDMFKKAMNASVDKNFKAKCLFMMAKCSQKNIGMPQYTDFTSDYDRYDQAKKGFIKKFMNNKYFPQLIKEYSTTDFYKEVKSRCSYLRDFYKRK